MLIRRLNPEEHRLRRRRVIVNATNQIAVLTKSLQLSNFVNTTKYLVAL